MALGLVLTTPWLMPTLENFILPSATTWHTSAPTLGKIHGRFFTGGLGTPVLVAAGLGFVSGIIKRRRFIITLFVWVTMLVILANPGYFRIPFPGGFINQLSIEIMLFFPISLLAGYMVSQGIGAASRKVPFKGSQVWFAMGITIGVGIAILGAQRLLPTLNPVTFLFREPDQEAMAWIKTNIPENEVIVINPTGWGYGLYRGQDGGYWISAMTGRATLPPNALYGFSAERVHRVNPFIEELLGRSGNAYTTWTILQDYGYSYIYIGARGGVLSPEKLNDSRYFDVLYHEDATWIFKRKEDL
jgi:hypothetical protein